MFPVTPYSTIRKGERLSLTKDYSLDAFYSIPTTPSKKQYTMPRPVSDKDILANIEKQVQNLTDEIAIRTAATTQGLACSEILAYAESQPEPFVVNDNKDATPGSSAINPWHKNPGGGGGCTIL